MKFIQKVHITTALRGPFILTKVPISLKEKISRKKFSCGYKAMAELQKLTNLDPKRYYGADVVDSRGLVVAEVE
jgi:hypothetical protein